MDFLSFREQVTQYIFVEDQPEVADIIWIPGNAYPQNAECAANLYKQGFASYILPSGRYSATVGQFAGVQEKSKSLPRDSNTCLSIGNRKYYKAELVYNKRRC